MNKPDGYYAAVSKLAYELVVRAQDVFQDALDTGDTTRWENLSQDAISKGAHDPVYGDELWQLEKIFWEINKTYDVPMEAIQEDLDIAQKLMIQDAFNRDTTDRLWDD